MGGPMRHIMVSRVGSEIVVHKPFAEPLELQNHNMTYEHPAGVLTGTWHNAQHGWMNEGSWPAPAGGSVWFELVEMSAGLSVYEAVTFAPILGTASSPARYEWNRVMLHNQYASTVPGPHWATYTVYFGDAGGEPIDGYGSAEVTLNFTLPSPACNAADLFEPYGVLNSDDVIDFVVAFNAGDSRADIFPPPAAARHHTTQPHAGDGVLNSDDVIEFVNQFTAGCP